MALPSQTERANETNRTVMAQPSGGLSSSSTAKIMLVGLTLVAAAGVVWGVKKYNAKNDSVPANIDPIASGTAPAPGSLSDALQTVGPRTDVPGSVQTQPTVPNKVDVTKPDLTAVPANTPPVTTLSGQTAGQPSGIPTGTPAGTPGTAPNGTAGGTPGNNTFPASVSTSAVAQLIEQGNSALAGSRTVDARALFSRAYLHAEASDADRDALRTKLTLLSDELLFSNKVTAGDPLVETYSIASGDALEKIAKKRDLAAPWSLITRINKMSNPNAIRVGQKIKLARGPFHAIVDKSDYRIDIFQGSPDESDRWVFVKTLKVGLGEGNSTPLGTYVVKNKQKNPAWVNPRNSKEKFTPDDPKNPIGEFWIGLLGQGDAAVNVGYGIHGTIDPESIGQQKSMGCVRLVNDDVATVYDFLIEKLSVVKIVP